MVNGLKEKEKMCWIFLTYKIELPNVLVGEKYDKFL